MKYTTDMQAFVENSKLEIPTDDSINEQVTEVLAYGLRHYGIKNTSLWEGDALTKLVSAYIVDPRTHNPERRFLSFLRRFTELENTWKLAVNHQYDVNWHIREHERLEYWENNRDQIVRKIREAAEFAQLGQGPNFGPQLIWGSKQAIRLYSGESVLMDMHQLARYFETAPLTEIFPASVDYLQEYVLKKECISHSGAAKKGISGVRAGIVRDCSKFVPDNFSDRNVLIVDLLSCADVTAENGKMLSASYVGGVVKAKRQKSN
ncbi:MAG: hypothetical protein OEZ43_21095 [Gammaproteobacteria bacterium]|nr:hypothetical protein [Gammaproteobacteria bacterium]